MIKKILCIFFLCLLVFESQAREFHVAIKGNDNNSGTESAPFRTIGKASQMAYPGDIITVHAGTYREWVNPPRGGESDEKKIVYRAAPGEKVAIKGSERITNWVQQKEAEGVWKAVIPNEFFGNYNPYIDEIYGDWFDNYGRVHHTGEVFLNDKSLYEKESLEKVLHPVAHPHTRDSIGSLYTWYCENDGANTIIWANFHKHNPNKELVEINVRKTCFYPEKKGLNYITLQGFHISQAATQWAPPTAEQIGMVATHWNKGWIIENNVISNSKCSGITLGKERNSGHNNWLNDQSIDGSIHYIEVTFNAIREGWNPKNIGHHIVRNNEVSHCEQTGICGSMGCSFSIFENNDVHDIWEKRQFNGWEIAGIKLHGAVDAQIIHNHIHTCGRGYWLDWMTQGVQVSRNLFYDNDLEDIYVEVNHGPYLMDNNIFGSPANIKIQSQGGAFVHNLFMGKIIKYIEHGRYTPYFLPHSTDVAGLSIIPGGDDRFMNNVFAPAKLDVVKQEGSFGIETYNEHAYPMYVEDNVYYKDSKPFNKEINKHEFHTFDPDPAIESKADGVYLRINLPESLAKIQPKTVTTERLGQAKLPEQKFEHPDGSPITIDFDYYGNKRGKNPIAGAIESRKQGNQMFKVW